MNLSQLALTLLLAAAATISTNATKQVHEVEVVMKRDKQHNIRKLRNQKMRKLNRVMSIPNTDMPVSPRIITDSPTPSPADSTDEPTNDPTSAPTGNDCDNIGNVKETRSGVVFDLQYSDNQSCRDANGNRYEYGEIDNIDNFNDCAETCVQDVPSALLSRFRGIDFVCQRQNSNQERDSCRCLYDAGTLESNSRAVASDGVFDSTNTDGTGKGSVGHGGGSRASKFQRAGSTEDKEVVCVEVESSRLVDVAIA